MSSTMTTTPGGTWCRKPQDMELSVRLGLLLSILGASVPGCAHEFDTLSSGVPDLVPSGTSEVCMKCMQQNCHETAMVCLDDASCAVAFRSCGTPRPACALRSVASLAFAECFTNACSDDCNLTEHRLDCVGNYLWETPVSGQHVAFTVTLDPTMMDTGLTDTPLSVTACTSTEEPCPAPTGLRAGAPIELSFDQGLAYPAPFLSVFDGGAQPFLFFETLVISPNYDWRIRVISRTHYALLLASAGLPADESLGTLVIGQHDCSAVPIAGVSFTVRRSEDRTPAGGTPFYMVGEYPSIKETATAPPYPKGGVANLRPGRYDVSSWFGGREIGRKLSVPVRADTITSVVLFPLTDGE